MTQIEKKRILEAFQVFINQFSADSIRYNCLKFVEIYPADKHDELIKSLQSLNEFAIKKRIYTYADDVQRIQGFINSGGNDYDVGCNIQIPIDLENDIKKWTIYFFKSRANLLFGVHTFELEQRVTKKVQDVVNRFVDAVYKSGDYDISNEQFKHYNVHYQFSIEMNQLRLTLLEYCHQLIRNKFNGFFSDPLKGYKIPCYEYITFYQPNLLKQEFSFRDVIGGLFSNVLDLRRTDQFELNGDNYFVSNPFYSEYLHYTFLSEDDRFWDTNVMVNPFFEFMLIDVLMNMFFQIKRKATNNQKDILQLFEKEFDTKKISQLLKHNSKEYLLYEGILNEVNLIITTMKSRFFKRKISARFENEMIRTLNSVSDLKHILSSNLDHLNSYLSTNGSIRQISLNSRMFYLTVFNIVLAMLSIAIANTDKVVVVVPEITTIIRLLSAFLF